MTDSQLTSGAAQLSALPDDASQLADTASAAQWASRYAGALLGVFGTPQRVLVRGEGAYVWDADGNKYLDLLGGIAVNALGHAHPTLTAAISAQLGTIGHVSNFFATPTQVSAAEQLLRVTEAPAGSRVFFTNSGTEANEAAFKMVRRHGGTDKPRILALEGAFHGRSMGALSLTAKPQYREPFAPLPAEVEFLPFGDLEALEAALTSGTGQDVAALFVEPIQGEAGVRPLPAGYLAGARELTARHGTLLVVDEVQTGMGRVGKWLASHGHFAPGTYPDIVTLAKGLGGGIPVGAVIAHGEQASALLNPGQHGTTFGGNPIATVAVLATLSIIERDNLLAHTAAVGEYLRSAVRQIENPLIAEVRGEGLLIAIELTGEHAPDLVQAGLRAGFIMNAATPSAVRLAPPLILTRAQADSFVEFFAAALAELPAAGKES